MAIASLDAEILEEKFKGEPLLELWKEYQSAKSHFNIAFETRADDSAKEYLDEMNFIAVLIRARPALDKQGLLDFFEGQYKLCLDANNFDAASYFLNAKDEFSSL
jgi:hypothetical protein